MCTLTCTMDSVGVAPAVTNRSCCRFRHLCVTPSGTLHCRSNPRLNNTLISLSTCGHENPICDISISTNAATLENTAAVQLPGVWVLLREWISNNWGHTLRNTVLPALAALLTFHPLSDADITRPLYLGANLPNALSAGNGTVMSDALFRGFFRLPALPLHTLLSQHLHQFVCFEEALLGFAAFDAEYRPVNELLFTPPLLRLARQRAYESFNLPMVNCLSTLRVLLHIKRPKLGMKGAIAHPQNVARVLEARGHQFRGIPIVLQNITWTSQKTFRQQLQLVSGVDLLISDGGAAADYAMFLPPGSAAILTPKFKHCAEISHPWNLLRHVGDVLVVRYPFEAADCMKLTRRKDRLLGFFVDVPLLLERLNPSLDAAFAYILEHKQHCVDGPR
eukprot:GGOE01014701.1.p1 GENE.GGOE01014701.1~~GGOE01014701.1.p1  ORF type:complete len:435 (-),score=64.90 GGOE01014701.1:283-1458(-)